MFFVYFLKEIFCAFWPLIDRTAEGLGRKRGRERECHTAKGRRAESNQGSCSEDTASVHGVPALPMELPGTP